jgi:hypothetical protein
MEMGKNSPLHVSDAMIAIADRRRMSWMWRHNPRRLCTLYSLVAPQLTRKGLLPATAAPLAVEIPLIAS